MDFTGLPGADFIDRGLRDLETGILSVEALLVLVGAPRLRELGIAVPMSPVDRPEHRLYERLTETHDDGAHARYNALIRTLVSFERAAACVR